MSDRLWHIQWCEATHKALIMDTATSSWLCELPAGTLDETDARLALLGWTRTKNWRSRYGGGVIWAPIERACDKAPRPGVRQASAERR